MYTCECPDGFRGNHFQIKITNYSQFNEIEKTKYLQSIFKVNTVRKTLMIVRTKAVKMVESVLMALELSPVIVLQASGKNTF